MMPDQHPRTPPLQLALFWSILGLGTLWMIYLAIHSPGSSLHDEISHYFIARESWTNPLRLLDVWGRPGNTLFYVLPSAISLGARRWWAVITCVLVALIATRSARRLGLRHVWLVPLALYLQPWYVQLGFTSITQIPFMLVLTIAIDQWIRGRLNAASLCFGLLPTIRHEGLALTAVWLAYLGALWLLPLLRRSERPAAIRLGRLAACIGIALLPMLVWNALHLVFFGRLASNNLLELRPTDIYGSGDWLHFVAPFIASVGFAIAALGALGAVRLWRSQPSALLYAVPAAAYFIIHTLIYRFGLFASGGYIIFLLPMAPTVAILAAFGAEQLPRWLSAWEGRWLSGRTFRVVRLATVGLVFGAALFYSGAAALAVRPWQLQPNEIAAQEAADWLVQHDLERIPVYSTHVWFFWLYEDEGLLVRIGGNAKLTPDEVMSGGLVLWDRNYGDLNGITLADLQAPGSGFTELARFYQDEMILFQKR